MASNPTKVMYQKVVQDRVEHALNMWNLSNPGRRPDALLVGDMARSQMSLADAMRVAQGVSGTEVYYGNIRLMFCESLETCMFISNTPA